MHQTWQGRNAMNKQLMLEHNNDSMNVPSLWYYITHHNTRCKLFVILIWKYCLLNKITFDGSYAYVNTAQWHANAIYKRFVSEQNIDKFCKLEGIKNDEFWNVTRS